MYLYPRRSRSARHIHYHWRIGNYRHHPRADLEAAAAHPVVGSPLAGHSDHLRYGNPMYLYPRRSRSARHIHYHWRIGNYRHHPRADLEVAAAHPVVDSPLAGCHRRYDSPMYLYLRGR